MSRCCAASRRGIDGPRGWLLPEGGLKQHALFEQIIVEGIKPSYVVLVEASRVLGREKSREKRKAC